MTFNPGDYISSDESIVLSGNIKGRRKLILTSKKIIISCKDHLNIIPLNKISEIYYVASDESINVVIPGDSISISCPSDPSWFSKLIVEISSRIG